LNHVIKVDNSFYKGDLNTRACNICICNTVCTSNSKCGRQGCKKTVRDDGSRPCNPKLGHFPCEWMKTNGDDVYGRIC